MAKRKIKRKNKKRKKVVGHLPILRSCAHCGRDFYSTEGSIFCSLGCGWSAAD